jgi:signal transduction histidine kinase
MCIWFYLFLVMFIGSIFLFVKLILIRKEINNITCSLAKILNTDTNKLLTCITSDKLLKDLVRVLNKRLKELRKLEIEYKQGNQSLKSAITNISHDLRTPLTAIRGYVELMGDENPNQQQQDYLRIIDAKVQDLGELTEQLFDFSKNLDLQQEIRVMPVCLNDVLIESIVSFYSLFKKCQMTPQLDLCEEKVVRLLNENILKRIFENIISNAVKYGQSDLKIRMTVDGVIEFSNDTDELDFTRLGKLFDRYYTVQDAKRSSGVGLSIARQLVDLSGGTIDASYQESVLKIMIRF